MSTPVTPSIESDVTPAARALVIIFGATLIVSAGLLFWLQPMIAKLVLPKVGGTPAVWNTAMLFFQTALLVGYAYAHILSRHLELGKQMVVHLALLGLCVLWLPIGLSDGVPPVDSDGGFGPSLWILGELALNIGAPFVVIAGSAPILQSWFARSRHRDAANPYFLYAASNIGSMTALFAFPLAIEPTLDLGNQQNAWSIAFALLVVLTMVSVFSVRRQLAPAPALQDPASAAPLPSVTARFLWLTIVLMTTSLMLGLTTHLTMDVAAVPLLWVVPLGIYLLTFIISFARRPLVSRQTATILMLAALLAYGVTITFADDVGWSVMALVLCLVFGFTTLAAHSELARLRPDRSHLTAFYLWIATGGMLGGAFNALAAPALFDDVIEFPMMLAVGIVLVLAARRYDRGQPIKVMAILAGLCVAAPMVASPLGLLKPDGVLLRERNFYGVLSVRDNVAQGARMLGYGTTVHGVQDMDRTGPLVPLSYYSHFSPAADVWAVVDGRANTGNVGAVGLGIGTIACYPLGGRELIFFEINPGVTRIAADPRYFRYLSECPTPTTVVHGDGRLTLAARPNSSFDLLFIDAFTSDSIPVHLLTREAVALYMTKLSPGGLLALHVTNTHLDLVPVIAAIARDLGLRGIRREAAASDDADKKLFYPDAHYVVLAREQQDLDEIAALPGWQPLPEASNRRAWTDAYSNIVGAFRVFQ